MTCLVLLFFIISYFILPCLFPPFYYADFNNVKKNFEAIEGVKILDNWQHHDISLEDCGFVISYRGQEPVQIDFYEGGDWDTPFEAIDGYTISSYRSRKKGRYDDIVKVRSSHLKEQGISATNLKEFLSNQDKVITFALSNTSSEPTPSKNENWIRVFTKLDAYK